MTMRTLYHGTTTSALAGLASGFTTRLYEEGHETLTESRAMAENLARQRAAARGGDPVVLTLQVDDDDLYLPGYFRWNDAEDAMTYAIRRPLPASAIVAVTPVGKTAKTAADLTEFYLPGAQRLSGEQFEEFCQRVLDEQIGRKVKIDFDLLYAPSRNGGVLAEASWDPDRKRAYIAWSVFGLNDVVALHECAHVLAGYRGQDDDHGPAWQQTFRGLLGQYAPAIHIGGRHVIAFPSWRDRGAVPQEDIVIKPDTGMGSRRLFEVILSGQTEARFPTMAGAKDFVRTIYGDVDWRRVPGDQTPHDDPTWGATREFNDSRYYLVADAPRLAPNVAHLAATTWYHAGDATHFAPHEFVHLGTRGAAMDRRDLYPTRGLYEISIAPTHPLGSPAAPLTDKQANTLVLWATAHPGVAPASEQQAQAFDHESASSGAYGLALWDVIAQTGWTPAVDALYYENFMEDAGSVSVAVLPSAITSVREVIGEQEPLWGSNDQFGFAAAQVTSGATQHTGIGYVDPATLTDRQRNIYMSQGDVLRQRQHRLYDSFAQFEDEARKVLQAQGCLNADALEVLRSGFDGASSAYFRFETGGAGPFPTIQVGVFSCNEVTMLHECAHLLVGQHLAPGTQLEDGGHTGAWLDTFNRLVQRYGSAGLKSVWPATGLQFTSGANGDLPDVEIRYVKRYPRADAVVALQGGQVVGLVTWHEQAYFAPKVVLVWVREDLRRRGLATALLRQAEQHAPGLEHSTDRTDAAEAWSATTGFPRDERESQHSPQAVEDSVRRAIEDIQQRLTATASVEDYGGQHQPSNPDEYGQWADDMLDDSMIPADWPQHPEWYTGFPQWAGPVVRALLAVQGKPTAPLTIYRATPGEVTSIERGNWVTLSRAYAQEHLGSNGAPGWHILSAMVPAHTVGFGGDDLMEWGYWGPDIAGHTASKTASGVDDYQGEHTPPSPTYAPPLHDLLAVQRFPGSVYDHLEDYAFGPFASASLSVVRKVRGKPDAPVTIYRAIPASAQPTINSGDWVALSKGYARAHARARGDMVVVSAVVAAKYVYSGGNDLVEWGYWGPDLQAHIASRTAALTTTDYEGQVGNRDHITRVQYGTVPTAAIADLLGAKGERPGEHRNRQGAKWEAFLDDIKANGIKTPIFITCDFLKKPVISEGNHRRDAAVALGLPEVPVEIRYYGHGEDTSVALGAKTATIDWGAYEDGSYVARGFKMDVSSGHLAKAFIDGTVTAQQIVDAAHTLTGRVGGWWGVLDRNTDRNFGLADIADFSYTEDTLRELQEQGLADSIVHGEVMIVLIGRRPTMPDGQPWDPTEHNPIDPLMGNSFLREHFDHVDLVEILYDAGWGWKTLPAPGIRVKASAAEVPWTQVVGDNDGFRLNGGQVEEYIQEKMGVDPRDLVWTLEGFPLSDMTTDPNGVRSKASMEWARQRYESGQPVPPIVAIEHDGVLEHVDGWHRLGGAAEAGLDEVPAYVGRRRLTMTAAAPPVKVYRGLPITLDAKDPRTKDLLRALAQGATNAATDRLWQMMAEGTGTDRWTGKPDGPHSGMGTWWTTNKDDAGTYSMGDTVIEGDAFTASVLLYAEIDDSVEHAENNTGSWYYHVDPGTPLVVTRMDAELPTAEQARRLLDALDKQGGWFDPDGMGDPTTWVKPGTDPDEEWVIQTQTYQMLNRRIPTEAARHTAGGPLPEHMRILYSDWAGSQHTVTAVIPTSKTDLAKWPTMDLMPALMWEYAIGIGTLYWHIDSGVGEDGIPFEAGEIAKIEVQSGYRHRGVATALWNEARRIDPRVHHSPVRSDEGEGWVHAVSPGVAPRAYDWDSSGEGEIRPVTATKGASVSAYRGILLHKYDTQWNSLGPDASDQEIASLIQPTTRTFSGGWMGAYWTTDKALAEQFALGVNNGSWGWGFGNPAPEAIGVVLEAVRQTNPAFSNDFTWSTENTVAPPTPETTERLLVHVYRANPQDSSRPIYVRTFELPRGLWKTASGNSTSAMVALVPPLDVARLLVDDDQVTEPLDNQHVTVVYLGKTADLDHGLLLETVEQWAAEHEPVVGTVRGYGTFDNDDEHVLYAAWAFEGGNGWRQDLVDTLGAVGIKDASSFADQEWTPHETLAYSSEPVTTLPTLPQGLPERVVFGSIVVAYGDDWSSFALGTI